MKQKIELELEIPENFEPTNEYRPPRDGEWFMDSETDEPLRSVFNKREHRLILRKLPPPTVIVELTREEADAARKVLQCARPTAPMSAVELPKHRAGHKIADALEVLY